MGAVVVFESMFGNTGVVAEAIAEGLASSTEVEVFTVDLAPRRLTSDVELLVIGGPTHVFGMSRRRTRRDAVIQYGAPPSTPVEVGMREWLAELEVPDGLAAATFDTRVKRSPLPGSAARRAARRLRRRGVQLVAPPASFWVAGTKGPLEDHERERAAAWGAELARAVEVRR